ncbi:hypothetical protein [Methylovulum miyakonense]|uniref:hypothetical protein n=1 Tax=Methylovulum miyakonense TaxID=645578 RepID=UPI000380065B|nr:hypothetical protein [Methylovulum miyakonense]
MSLLAIQFLSGLLYANAGEWLMHKYILHGLGGNPQSFWAYHLQEHHAVCAKHAMVDPGYQSVCLTTWNTQSKELVVLMGIVLLHLPLFFLLPALTSAIYLSLALYYYKHRKAHLDPVWAKRHLRWHYDHHLCNQLACGGNWCVTWPWFDHLLGTRKYPEDGLY